MFRQVGARFVGVAPELSGPTRLQKLSAGGKSLYPTLSKFTHSFDEVKEQFGGLENGERSREIVSVAGRVSSLRRSGKKMIFVDVVGGNMSKRIQVMLNARLYGDVGVVEGAREREAIAPLSFSQLQGALSRGDSVHVTGHPQRTKRGEMSVSASSVILGCPVMDPETLPFPDTLEDPATRFTDRSKDLITNRHSRAALRVRAKVLKAFRDVLDTHEYMEVETPVLMTHAGGAAARPFFTERNSAKATLALRIAPELPLKQLVVGGFDRVYEIGRVFRNEDVDASHNPEFTTMECYGTWQRCEDVLELTEELVVASAEEALRVQEGAVADETLPPSSSPPVPTPLSKDPETGDISVVLPTPKTTFSGSENEAETPTVVSLKRPFARVDFTSALQEALVTKGYQPGLPEDINSPDSIPELLKCARALGIRVGGDDGSEAPPGVGAAAILDDLAGELIEDQLRQPTFLTGHPVCMCPLAKAHPERPGISERAELFIGGREFANGYSELNDPREQRQRFLDQAEGAAEAHPNDEAYCKALETGLPPTAGLGVGIDRLASLLAGHHAIREVIAFPHAR